MNVPAIVKPKSVLVDMSDRYGMEPAAFEATVRATCMPPDKNGRVPSREEFAAFLLVAKEYRLNPITREIFAFMAKHGGIVPVVSVDGWLNLVNSHKECDGFSFDVEHDEAGKIISCTCTMHRKDRSHPVVVTEYFAECVRQTDPWRTMPHRMIRHKAMIQAARYAFGFSGIYDEDEGRTIAEAVDVTPKAPPRVPSPSEVEGKQIEHDHGSDKYRPGDVVDGNPASEKKDDPITSGPQPKRWLLPNIEADYDSWFNAVGLKIGEIDDAGELESFWNSEVERHHGTPALLEIDYGDLVEAYGKRQAALNSEE